MKDDRLASGSAGASSAIKQPRQPTRRIIQKLTKVQRTALRWARRKYQDGRVPPYVFRHYRTVDRLIDDGFIEPWIGYGAPMYKFTNKGIEALECE
jgi:hypothetical protein